MLDYRNKYALPYPQKIKRGTDKYKRQKNDLTQK
jgi:hypothetical protein